MANDQVKGRRKKTVAGRELKRLRRRFVFTNMLFVTLVMAVVCASVIVTNVYQRVNDVYRTLDMSLEFGAVAYGEPQGSPEGRDQFVSTAIYLVQSDDTVVSEVHGPWDLRDDELTEAIGVVGTALDGSDASNGGKVRGLIKEQNVYYQAYRLSDDDMLIAFAPGDYVDQGMGFAWVVIGISALAFVAFLFVSIYLSHRAVRPVEQAWNQQQQFVADASHELKTPLTVILANNSLIMADPSTSVASQMKWIESTEQEAKLMQGLVNDMLYLTRSDLGQGTQGMGKERVDFSDVVESIVLTFESVAFDRGVMIEDDVEQGICVCGDHARLLRMVSTLVDNACKYVSEAGRIRVKLAREGESCKLSVNNTGAAIDPEDLKHLFDRFYRTDRSRARQTGGFGLGLAIAQSIATDHGGTIEVASTDEVGTTFTVTLPVDSGE